MPLGKFFQKRSSQKKKKDGGSKDDSGTESDSVPSNRIEVLDENEVLAKLVTKKLSFKRDVPPTPRNSTCEELEKINLPLLESGDLASGMNPSLESGDAETSLEQCENADSSLEQSGGAETSLEQSRNAETSLEQSRNAETSLEQSGGAETSLDQRGETETSVEQRGDTESSLEQVATNHQPMQKRSNSASHFEINLGAQQSYRRKFGSEGHVLSNIGSHSPLMPRQKIHEVIGQYVEKLIRDSVAKAVKNVDVDSLCKEIVKDISNRRDSESADSAEDSIIEQRLSSDSFKELVELEYENIISFADSAFHQFDSYCSETGSAANELEDNTTFGGYLADYEDTASADDLKSFDEESSFLSMSDGLKQQCINENCLKSEKSSSLSTQEILSCSESSINQEQKVSLDENGQKSQSTEEISEQEKALLPSDNIIEHRENVDSSSKDSCFGQEQSPSSAVDANEPEVKSHLCECSDDLIVMNTECESLTASHPNACENENPPPDIHENLPQQQQPNAEEAKKINWKAGYLQVKLPHKSRGKANLKAWKKRCVAIQPDEFVNDPKNPSLVIGVYGTESRKHKATLWQTVSSLKAVIYRSSSHTHRYAFTIAEEGRAVIHLSADSESASQEWMAAIRAVLWPPSPFMQLEKMLSGREFEISLIDSEFSYHAGLLGMYGYLTITPRKLILLHPQQGYVVQEWYLNTVDKFQLVPQPKTEDAHKVLAMTTCSDSSTGKGEILLFCNEAVTLLQSLASTIHQVLSSRSKQEGGKYQKELEEMAEWLVSPPQDSLNEAAKAEEHYKVPPRQVKSLLDIPNFIFDKSLSPVASAIYPAPPMADVLEPLEASRFKPTTTSHDSGISTCYPVDDFLNCSITSFVVGGGPMTGKSSDSDLSDAYTPPRSPEVVKKIQSEQQMERLCLPKT